MSRKGKLRISSRYQEIVQILQKARSSTDNFVWRVGQDDGGQEKRQKFNVTIKEVDAKEARLTLEVSDVAIRELNRGDQVFFKLAERNSAFKATVLSMKEGQITCSFPEEAAVTELRESKRHYFHPGDEKVVQIKRLKSLAVERQDRTYSLLVCDISLGGLCLFLPEAQQSAIDLKHRIRLEALGPYRLEEPIGGEVMFKVPHQIRDHTGLRTGYRMGIQLEQKIPAATFDRYIVKKQMLSVADERLVMDEEFRAKVRENMDGIRDALRKNKQLDRFFENLLVPKSGNQYLRHHIEMLCEILCGLAVRLGWVSERSIDKLIYVAFMHDVRFTQFPKLAQIADQRAYEEQKASLTEAEQKAYFDSPVYASELARQDLGAYPDAIKILLQQKELPDGSGFPHGLTSAQLAPLSCLFITSHLFVDYVFDHPDWSVEDFVRSNAKKLTGQHFEKILEVMMKAK